MALAWEFEVDDDQDDVELDWLAGLMAAVPADPLPATILERLAAARPRWHARAACAGSAVDFFDPRQVDAAQALCAGCAVADRCGEAGQREPMGVWAGKPRGFGRPPPKPKPPKPPKPKPAALTLVVTPPKPITPAKPKPPAPPKAPRPAGPRVATCVDCGHERPITGRGLCLPCYSRDRRRRAGAQPKQVGKRTAACVDCAEVGPILCRGMCQACYWRARRRARS